MIAFLKKSEWIPSSLSDAFPFTSCLPILGRDGITEGMMINHSEYREHVKIFHHLSHKGNWCLGPGELLTRYKQEGVMLCCHLGAMKAHIRVERERLKRRGQLGTTANTAGEQQIV